MGWLVLGMYTILLSLLQGGNLDDVDDNGKQPIDLARGRRHRAILQYLSKQEQTIAWEWQWVCSLTNSQTMAVYFFCIVITQWHKPVEMFIINF